MATISLETVWISLAATPSVGITLEVSKLEESQAVSGEVRRYAGGRLRSVSRAGAARSYDLTFDVVGSRTSLATLRDWTGQTVLFRDPFGRKAYCVYFDSPLSERIPVDMPEVSLQLLEVTVSEAV